MDDHRSRLYEWLINDVNRTLLMVAAATLLGVGSLASFFASPGDTPTRLQLGLLVCAMALLFYLTLRSEPA